MFVIACCAWYVRTVCTKKIRMANRGEVWADAEVRALIGFWGDSRIQAELDGAVRNKAIREKIAMKMAEAGFNRDWKQCRAKIKNLKNDYKKI